MLWIVMQLNLFSAQLWTSVHYPPWNSLFQVDWLKVTLMNQMSKSDFNGSTDSKSVSTKLIPSQRKTGELYTLTEHCSANSVQWTVNIAISHIRDEEPLSLKSFIYHPKSCPDKEIFNEPVYKILCLSSTPIKIDFVVTARFLCLWEAVCNCVFPAYTVLHCIVLMQRRIWPTCGLVSILLLSFVSSCRGSEDLPMIFVLGIAHPPTDDHISTIWSSHLTTALTAQKVRYW